MWSTTTKQQLSPGGLVGKESMCNAGDQGSIPCSGRSLEKAMATYSSILAWRVPRTEKPCGLQSMGSQRVRHSWVTFIFHTCVITNMCYICMHMLLYWYITYIYIYTHIYICAYNVQFCSSASENRRVKHFIFTCRKLKWSASRSVMSDSLRPHGLKQSVESSRPEYWSG